MLNAEHDILTLYSIKIYVFIYMLLFYIKQARSLGSLGVGNGWWQKYFELISAWLPLALTS